MMWISRYTALFSMLTIRGAILDDYTPKFCSQTYFGAVYHLGGHLLISYHEWMWEFNFTTRAVNEPPYMEYFAGNIDCNWKQNWNKNVIYCLLFTNI